MCKTLHFTVFYLFKAIKIELSDETAKLTVPKEMRQYFLLKLCFIEYDNFRFWLIILNDRFITLVLSHSLYYLENGMKFTDETAGFGL